MWLFSVVEKVRDEGAEAGGRHDEEPAPVGPPCRSARRASSHRARNHGRALSTSRMAGTISQRCRSSVIDQPSPWWNSQYPPATMVGNSGGLLE